MKKAIAVILTDTHLKEDNIDVNKSIFQQAIEIAHDLRLNSIEHGGDIFNSRKSQSQIVLNAFTDILDNLYNENIVLRSCVGNHDKTEYSSERSFLDQYAEHPALELFPIFGKCDLNNSINLHYVSFFSDPVYTSVMKDFKKIEYLNEKGINVLLTHIGISGAVMNNGTVIESELINSNLFKDFDLVLVGHYHDAQVLNDDRIKYIGASLQHNYGELIGKGLTVLYDDLSTKIIPLKYPQYIKYEISPKEITAKDIMDLKEEKEMSGDNIRIVLTGTNEEVKSFNKSILLEAGVSVQHKVDKVEQEELEQRVEAFDSMSLQEEFEIFCKKNKLNKEQGLKYFSHIIKN